MSADGQLGFQTQRMQRLEHLADLGGFLAPFKLGEEARAQVLQSRDGFQRLNVSTTCGE